MLGDPRSLCRVMYSADWLADVGLLNEVGLDLLLTTLCVQKHNFYATSQHNVFSSHTSEVVTSEVVHVASVGAGRERTGKFLQLSYDFMTELLRIMRGHRVEHYLDLSVLLLSCFCGLLQVDITLACMLFSFVTVLNFRTTAQTMFSHRCTVLPPLHLSLL